MPNIKNGRSSAKVQSRIEELRAILKKHGPLTRQQIIDRAAMPVGTINANLTRNNFAKDEQGRWTAEIPNKASNRRK